MSMGNRLRPEAHANLPWRLNEFASDFELVDAWLLPASGTFDEFDDLYVTIANLNEVSEEESRSSAALFAVRRRLGQRFGWDDPKFTNTLPIPGCKETSLRERLPSDLAASSDETFGRRSNFRPVFVLKDEAAIEISNTLIHAILHLGWVEQSDKTYRGQMGIYVKHRGAIGRPYMTAIAPFRHLIVYPALLTRIEKAWKARIPNAIAQSSDGPQSPVSRSNRPTTRKRT